MRPRSPGAPGGSALRVRARSGGVALLWGPAAAGPADLELAMSAEDAHDYFTGTLDPALALRTGTIRSSQPRDRALRALSVLKALRLPRLRRLATWERTAAGLTLPEGPEGPPVGS